MNSSNAQKSLAVGGGKGGVGKSVVAANLACAFARTGRRVLLVDADLAGANLHTLFGISVPGVTLADLLEGTASRLDEVLLPTELPNLRLLCGASEFIEIANPQYARKQKLLRLLEHSGFDLVVIDIGAGASLNNVDFFNIADLGLLVSGPDPTAIQNAYGFLKVAVQRRMIRACESPEARTRLSGLLSRSGTQTLSAAVDQLRTDFPEAAESAALSIRDVHYRLLVNMAQRGEGNKLAQVMAAVTRQFLGISLPCKGIIPHSVELANSVRRRTPVMLREPGEAARHFEELASLLGGDMYITPRTAAIGEAPSPRAESTPGQHLLVCLNDEITRAGEVLHVQTEDLGPGKKRILSLVYRGGHILHSREQPYLEEGHAGVVAQVRHQQQAVLAGIRAGKLDERMNRDDG